MLDLTNYLQMNGHKHNIYGRLYKRYSTQILDTFSTTDTNEIISKGLDLGILKNKGTILCDDIKKILGEENFKFDHHIKQLTNTLEKKYVYGKLIGPLQQLNSSD